MRSEHHLPTRARRPSRGRGVVVAASVAACLAVPRVASAFCREVTASPPANYDPTVQGCYAGASGSLPTLFWRNQCVSYSLQKDSTHYVPLAQAQAVAATAFAAWTQAACPGGGNPSITPSAYPAVSCNAIPSQEHNNPIIFHDNSWPYADRSNAIGYTTLTVNLDTGEILGAAIEINSYDYTIVTSGATSGNTYDLASILTHEAGHFLGLAHSEQASAVMYALYTPGSTALSADDVNGICSIYPADGSRSTIEGSQAAMTCNPAPLKGFLDGCGSLDSGTAPSTGEPTGATTSADGGDPATCTYNVLSCSVGRVGGPERGAWMACAFSLLGVLGLRLRRASRSTRRVRAVRAAGLLSLAILGCSVPLTREARASVSVAAGLDELLGEATAAAVATPVEHRGLWEDGRIVTYTKLRVDRLIAGDLAGEVWVRTMGGAVGHIGQIVEGEASFADGQPSLLFLRAHGSASAADPVVVYGVAEGAQGQFPIVTDAKDEPRLAAPRGTGALVARAGAPPAASHPQSDSAREALMRLSVDAAAKAIAARWRSAHTRATASKGK